MRILLDTCVSSDVRDRLRSHGFDVVWSGEWPSDPGDDELLNIALRERRVLITLDKDFGELVVLKRKPHAGVVRLVGFRASEAGISLRRDVGAIRRRIEAFRAGDRGAESRARASASAVERHVA
jgi:predicted nuclease of predicted toxin-antitoxin system